MHVPCANGRGAASKEEALDCRLQFLDEQGLMNCADLRLLVLRLLRNLDIILGLPDVSGQFCEMFFSLWTQYPPLAAHLFALCLVEAKPSAERDPAAVVTLDIEPCEQQRTLRIPRLTPCLSLLSIHDTISPCLDPATPEAAEDEFLTAIPA